MVDIMILINLNNQDIELKYTLNSICTLEEKTGKGISNILSEENLGFNIIRLLIWAGLLHKFQRLNISTVGNWIENEIKKDFKSFENISNIAIKALTESGIFGNIKNDDLGNLKETL